MLGRPGCWNPVWMNVIAGSWLIASVCIVRITVMSSTIFAVCGRSSLTHSPDSPCCANENCELATGRSDCPIVCATRCPMRTESGICVPWYFVSAGL